MTSRSKSFSQDVDGFTISVMFSRECFQEALQYRPRPDDLFIVTFPKCGTTWAQTILLQLFVKGQRQFSLEEFHSAIPYLEMAGVESVESMKRPGAIKTHLPFNLQPYSPDAKYIYVARNPKDCCVSFYHHIKSFDKVRFADGGFDEFFEVFINGENDYGDYFDHVLSWYKHRNDTNVLFLTYEEMKRDTKGVIHKMAKFIGKEYAEMLEEDPEMMDNILHNSSFQVMKDIFNSAMKIFNVKLSDEEIDKLPYAKGIKHIMKFRNTMDLESNDEPVNFVRKGVVGDWRSHFSAEQSKRMDERFEKHLGNTDLAELWRKDMEL